MSRPEILAAVNWWVAQVERAPRHETGDLTANLLLSLRSSESATPGTEARKVFRASLTEKIETEIARRHPSIRRNALVIYSNYQPTGILGEAAREAGISHSRFPVKTMMRIDPYSVTVSVGYASKSQEIWRSENA